MDVNLRKTATDTAYIVVGVGVLGFQQAQVKRRDAQAPRELACAATPGTTLTTGTARPARSRAATEDCAASLGSLGTTIGGAVGATVGPPRSTPSAPR